jgi:hypothetical protein
MDREDVDEPRPPRLEVWVSLADENLYHAVGAIVFKKPKRLDTRLYGVAKDGHLTVCGIPADGMVATGPFDSGPFHFCPLCVEKTRQ